MYLGREIIVVTVFFLRCVCVYHKLSVYCLYHTLAGRPEETLMISEMKKK